MSGRSGAAAARCAGARQRRVGLLALALAALVGLAAPSAAEPQGTAAGAGSTLVVEVQGLRNARGQLLVALFQREKGFPDSPGDALQTRIVPLDGKPLSVSFGGLAPGTYAVSLVHDENRNSRLDKSFIGIPKEGFGVSNNVQPVIGAPSYDDAKLQVRAGEQRIEIRLIYY